MNPDFREGFEKTAYSIGEVGEPTSKTAAFFPHSNSKMIKITPIEEWVLMMQRRCPDAVRTRAIARDMKVFKKTPKRSK
jgi:hypothetical protein